MTEDLSALPTLVRFLPGFIKRRIVNRPNLIKILDNIGWLFFDKILRMGVGLLVGVWVARYLGPEQFGLFNYIYTVSFFFSAVATFGMDSIVVRNLIREPQQKWAILGSAAAIQVFGGLLSLLLAVILAVVINPNDVMFIVLVAFLSTSSLFKASDIIRFLFQSQLCSRRYVLADCAVLLFISFIKSILIISQASLGFFVFVSWVEGLATAIILLIIYVQCDGVLLNWRFQKDKWIQLVRDGAPLMASGLAMAGYMRMDQLMLGKMLGENAIGVFSAALKISEIWYFVPTVVMASLFPAVMAAKNKSNRLYILMLEISHVGMVLLALFLAIFMYFGAEWVVKMLYGVRYVGSGIILQIHIWSSVFVFLGVASHHWFVIEGLQNYILLRSLCGAALNFVLNLLLIPRYGPAGAAIASLIAHCLVNVLLNLFSFETRQLFWLQIRCILMVPLWSGKLFREFGLDR